MFWLLSVEAGMVADSPHKPYGAHTEPKNERANTPQRIASHIHGAVGEIVVHHECCVCCHRDGRKNDSNVKRLSHSNFHFH